MHTATISFFERYGPWALIAGASEGIGKSFAEQLAAHGINLILLSRNVEALTALAHDLQTRYRIEVQCHAVDLTGDDLESRIDKVIENIDLGLMIYNAGGSSMVADLFLDCPLSDLRRTVRLNCHGPLILAHKIGQHLRQRGHGGIMLISALSAFGGTAYVANYCATKSYELVLAQGLWAELRGYGVDVVGVAVGATITPAAVRAGMGFASQQNTQDSNPLVQAMTSDAVASEALAALSNGPLFIPGEHNRMGVEQLQQIPLETAIEYRSAGTASQLGKQWPVL